MKNYGEILIGVVLIIMGCCSTVTAQDKDNLIWHSDIESFAERWEKVGAFSGVDFAIDVHANGQNHHLMIVNKDKTIVKKYGPPNWAQRLDDNFPLGQVITVKGYLKTKDVDGFAAIALQAWHNNKIIAFGTTQSIMPVSGSQDWTELSFSIPIPDNTEKLRILCLLNGTGTSWFDNVRLYEGGVIQKTSWQPGQMVGLIGGSLGALFGIIAGLLGKLVGQNRKKYHPLMIKFLSVMTAIGAVVLVVGLYAYAARIFPWEYRYGLTLMGGLFVCVAGLNLKKQLQSQKQINAFKDHIADID